MVGQVTEPITSSKKEMKLNKNPQKNPQKHVTKTSRKKEKKKKQHPEIVPVVVIDSKPVSKLNAVAKNSMFCSRHLKRTSRTKKKAKDRLYKKGERVMLIKMKSVFENFWAAAHLRLDGKSLMQIIMGRGRLKLHQFPEYTPVKGISQKMEYDSSES